MTVIRLGLIARRAFEPARAALRDAATWLDGRGVTPVIDAESAREAGLDGRWPTAARDELGHAAQAIVVFGGDGSLLDAAGAVARSGAETPIMGVNLGRLGFLTEVGRADVTRALDAIVTGRTRTETRLMLRGVVRRGGDVAADRLALNDIVVTRGALSRMIEIAAAVDNQAVTDIKADGLILATATGSTAYNLSAGGPIVHPQVDAIVMTPIAPHTLTNRPIVLPAGVVVTLRPEIGPQSDVVATFDGQFGVPLATGDVVEVTRAPRVLTLLRTTDRTHYDMLREKLQWGR